MADSVIEDALFDHRLRLRQPARGFRAGTDSVLLAASAPPDPGPIIIDAGAGVGAVGLAVALRSPEARVLLIEQDAIAAELARQNIVINQLHERGQVIVTDFLVAANRRAAGLADGAANLVITNPPFFSANEVSSASSTLKRSAHIFPKGVALSTWIRACVALLAPGGRLVLIHRPESLPALLAACHNRLGTILLKPVHARLGQPAIRVLVCGIKDSRAPLSIVPPLALHEADGRFTKEVEAIHRGAQLIEWLH
jgi:tRNA1(Val) A37 N6-methylase TrmN6